jgi:hypothetical protein
MYMFPVIGNMYFVGTHINVPMDESVIISFIYIHVHVCV